VGGIFHQEDRLKAIPCFSHDVDVWVAFQHRSHFLPDEGMIVYD